METVNGNGERIRRDFSQKYTVVDPSATVSADLMNMLYAGYNNPISVSVPGVPLNKVQATMTNGTLQAVGPGKYIARPSKIGQDAVITVVSTNTGHPQQMGQYKFRVRKLPDPTPLMLVFWTSLSVCRVLRRCFSIIWVMQCRWHRMVLRSLPDRRIPSANWHVTVVSMSHV